MSRTGVLTPASSSLFPLAYRTNTNAKETSTPTLTSDPQLSLLIHLFLACFMANETMQRLIWLNYMHGIFLKLHELVVAVLCFFL